jgi:hypothetical protein
MARYAKPTFLAVHAWTHSESGSWGREDETGRRSGLKDMGSG